MTRWLRRAIASTIAVFCISAASAQTIPDYLDHPLGLLQSDWVRPDPSNNGTPISFYGIDNLDFRCRSNPAFMTLAEAISLSAVYYAYAENAYRGDFSSWRPGYPIERDFYDGSSIGAIDLLKRIDPSILPALIQLSVDRLSGWERELAQSGIAALLGRYQPVVQRLDALGDDITFLLEQLEFPNYEVNVISEFGLPQDGDPCFSNYFTFNVMIGDEQSYAAFWSIDHYLDTFWVRRYAEGSHRMVQTGIPQMDAIVR